MKINLFQLKKKTGGKKIQLLSLELPGKIQDEQLNLKLSKFPSGPMAMITRSTARHGFDFQGDQILQVLQQGKQNNKKEDSFGICEGSQESPRLVLYVCV